MNILAKIRAGSQLYGMAGPNSDSDYKLIHLPPVSECLTDSIRHHFSVKNEAENWESESFSLQSWMRMAKTGESVAIDMLVADGENLVSSSSAWEFIYRNRSKFWTKRMSGALGFSRSQAAKYSTRADRFEIINNFIVIVLKAQQKGFLRLYEIWDDLPIGPHVKKDAEPKNMNARNRYIDICGKRLQETSFLDHALTMLRGMEASYGSRVRAAAGENIDWKSMSHAFRVAYALKAIYTTGDFRYPLAENDFLRDLKFGKLNFKNDNIEKRLDELILSVEALSQASALPEQVDPVFANNLILSIYKDAEEI